MPSTHPSTKNSIRSVVTALMDAIEGYEEFQQRAKPDLRPYLAELSEMHRKHLLEITETAKKNEIDIQIEGSVMGLIHKTAIRLRDAVDDLDLGVIDTVRDGEARIVDIYDDALERVDQGDPLQLVLSDQRAHLSSKIDDLPEAA